MCHFLGKVKVTIVTGDFWSAWAQLGSWFHCGSLSSIIRNPVDFCSSYYYYYQNILLIIDAESSAMSPRCFSTHIWKEFWAWLMTWLNHSQAFGLSGAGCVGDWDVKYVLLAGTFASLNVLSALLNYLYILYPSNNSIIGFLVTFQILYWYRDLNITNQSNVHPVEVIRHQNKEKFKSQHKNLLLFKRDIP